TAQPLLGVGSLRAVRRGATFAAAGASADLSAFEPASARDAFLRPSVAAAAPALSRGVEPAPFGRGAAVAAFAALPDGAGISSAAARASSPGLARVASVDATGGLSAGGEPSLADDCGPSTDSVVGSVNGALAPCCASSDKLIVYDRNCPPSAVAATC